MPAPNDTRQPSRALHVTTKLANLAEGAGVRHSDGHIGIGCLVRGPKGTPEVRVCLATVAINQAFALNLPSRDATDRSRMPIDP